MTLAHLLNTCPACGAEESLDALVMRMIDDDQVRRLIADVLTVSLALGSLTLRYLRLHKPAKQRMRLERVHAVLGELLPDMQRHAITHKGRDWAVSTETWKLGLQAVFEAAAKNTLTLPLTGNAYLYETLMRLVDKAEGAAERDAQAKVKQGVRSYADAPGPAATTAAVAVPPPRPLPVALVAPPPPPSRYAQQVAAQNAARQAQQSRPAATDQAPNNHD